MKRMLKSLVPVLIVLAQASAARADTPVYFAGLAYIGNASSMDRAAPYAASLIKDSQALTEYNGQLFAAMREVNLFDVRLDTSSGRSNSGEASN